MPSRKKQKVKVFRMPKKLPFGKSVGKFAGPEIQKQNEHIESRLGPVFAQQDWQQLVQGWCDKYSLTKSCSLKDGGKGGGGGGGGGVAGGGGGRNEGRKRRIRRRRR